jgi:hypothetical protein
MLITPSIAEIMNEWSYTFTPTYALPKSKVINLWYHQLTRIFKFHSYIDIFPKLQKAAINR